MINLLGDRAESQRQSVGTGRPACETSPEKSSRPRKLVMFAGKSPALEYAGFPVTYMPFNVFAR